MTHKLTLVYEAPTGPITSNQTMEGTENFEKDVEVAESAVKQEVNVEFNSEETDAMIFSSDVDVAIGTNVETPPDDVISLKANVPFVWSPEMTATPSPFSQPIVNKLFVTNNNNPAKAGTLKIRVLSTPAN